MNHELSILWFSTGNGKKMPLTRLLRLIGNKSVLRALNLPKDFVFVNVKTNFNLKSNKNVLASELECTVDSDF